MASATAITARMMQWEVTQNLEKLQYTGPRLSISIKRVWKKSQIRFIKGIEISDLCKNGLVINLMFHLSISGMGTYIMLNYWTHESVSSLPFKSLAMDRFEQWPERRETASGFRKVKKKKKRVTATCKMLRLCIFFSFFFFKPLDR